MLALFLDEEVIPEDLHRVPYVVVEVAQRPLALTPMNDNFVSILVQVYYYYHYVIISIAEPRRQ